MSEPLERQEGGVFPAAAEDEGAIESCQAGRLTPATVNGSSVSSLRWGERRPLLLQYLRNNCRRIALGLLGPFLLILLWYLAVALRLFEPSLLSTPTKSLATLWDLLITGSIFPDIYATLWRMFAGYFLAAVVGITLGLLLGVFRPAYETFSAMVDFFRSTPVTTLYPLFVLLFGVGHSSKIAMVFWACFFVIALNSAYGAFRVTKVRKEMARLYGATPLQIFRWVVFRDALPQTMIGLRVAISYALIVEVLCEMFMGSKHGLGQRVIEAYSTYAIENIYAIVIITGVIGYVLNRLFVVLERRVVPWMVQ